MTQTQLEAEMLQALKDVHAEIADYCDEHDGKFPIRPELQSRMWNLIAKAESYD